MLTNIKVCGKYQHEDGSRALINGKKPRPKKIFQKHKSKFVEDLENDNDNREDDNDNKKEDFEEYSLEYDDAGSEDDVPGAASGGIAIQDSNPPKLPKNLESNDKNNNLKSNDDDNDFATTEFSNNIPSSDEKDDLLNNYDLTTDLFSGDYQTEDSLSNSEFQTNGPPITTIFPQKHERQTKRNVVSIPWKIGIFFEKSEHFTYYKRL